MPGHFWQAQLLRDQEDEFYLDMGIVRCDPKGVITDSMPIGKLRRLKYNGRGLDQLEAERSDLQENLSALYRREALERDGKLDWNYDKAALYKKYRSNDELYKKEDLQASSFKLQLG